jgi:hypothetical protein
MNAGASETGPGGPRGVCPQILHRQNPTMLTQAESVTEPQVRWYINQGDEHASSEAKHSIISLS